VYSELTFNSGKDEAHVSQISPDIGWCHRSHRIGGFRGRPSFPRAAAGLSAAGIYIGGQIGYAWGAGNFNETLIDPVTGTLINTSVGGKPNGVIGGAHVGYNLQINQWVIGLEGTVDGTSLSNTAVAFFPVAFRGSTLTAQTTADIQGSIRGRLGIAWDRVLIYGTGGVAFGGFNTDVSIAAPNARVPFFASRNFSNTRVGWTAGGGIEYAITNNWSIRTEYRFSDFGTVREGLGFPAGGFFNAHRRLQQNQVQVGFSYKFDTWAPTPVVAKY
jgi:opacity protein-like surface antigen